MLSISEYREAEAHNISSISSWVYSSIHNLDIFQSAGFPVRIERLKNLSLIIDSMHENRFERYMKELNGLKTDEFEQIIDALEKFVELQITHLGEETCRVPITTFLSAFTLTQKLKAIIKNQNHARIFEIGPGCGYQSYFISNEQNVSLYAQTEAAESFYILQSLVNASAFGTSFKNEAIIEKANPDFFYNKSAITADTANYISVNKSKKCIQYPWWNYGKAVKLEQFNVVTSNANLLEFSPGALDNYLEFSSTILDDDGLFLAQCTGSSEKRNHSYLAEKLESHGYSVLFFSVIGKTIDKSHIPNSKFKLEPHHPTVFNLLLCKNTHSEEKFRYHKLNSQGANFTDTKVVAEAFFGRSTGNTYTKEDFLKALEERF